MLLRSANDAAVCVAENVAGSETKFVEMMNAKAKLIGAKDTHFVSPHGLYDPRHYSTAYDLAMIARYAIRYPEFNEIVKTKVCRISRSIDQKDVSIKNTANFLWKFDGADGIKTGYTKEAGHCFVGSATRNGWRLITVLLKSRSCGQDAASLLNYGFDTFKPVVFARSGRSVATADVAGGVVNRINVVPARSLAIVVKKHDVAVVKSEIKLDGVVAPVRMGEKIGVFTAFVNGRQVGSVELLAARPVGRTFMATAWLVLRWLIAIIGLSLLGILVYGRTFAKASRRRRGSIPSSRRAVDLVGKSGRRWQSDYSTRDQDRP
jgi:D-alanyl-D-alanine carboxypeptidase (penicillin-binding protein 5/6)